MGKCRNGKMHCSGSLNFSNGDKYKRMRPGYKSSSQETED